MNCLACHLRYHHPTLDDVDHPAPVGAIVCHTFRVGRNVHEIACHCKRIDDVCDIARMTHELRNPFVEDVDLLIGGASV
jgi:hypothetical protein